MEAEPAAAPDPAIVFFLAAHWLFVWAVGVSAGPVSCMFGHKRHVRGPARRGRFAVRPPLQCGDGAIVIAYCQAEVVSCGGY